MNKIILKKGRDESLRRFHPWVFSGAVNTIDGSPKEGELVEVDSIDGHFLAYGHYQIGSISVRILSFDIAFAPVEKSPYCFGLDAFGLDFWVSRLSAAKAMRESLPVLSLSEGTNSYRLVHGEGDSLPGLIIDFYDGVAVMQAHSAGMFLSRNLIVEALKQCYGASLLAVYDKSEGTAPFKAGLELADGYLWRDPSYNPSLFERTVLENGHKFMVNWETGQKTGFFLDQRDNRKMVGDNSHGRNVLNLFCYTGGFSVYALACGALSVTSVDSSQSAIDMVKKNIDINGFENSRHEEICADAIDYLKVIPSGAFDLIVVDPPAFAKHRGALDNALRAYKRLNASAIEKVAKGGLIFTYSCSQVVDKQAFALAVFSAAAMVGRSVRILRRLTQPADHPVNIYHPEGEYLKGLVLYVE